MLNDLSDKLSHAWHVVKHILQLAWAAPISIVCFVFYVLPCWLSGWYRLFDQIGDAYVFVHNPEKMAPWLAKLWEGWAGQSMGNFIVLKYVPGTSDAANRSLAHELVHTRQVMTWGILQPIAYVLSSATACMAGENHYRMNHFEIAARRAAGQKIE